VASSVQAQAGRSLSDVLLDMIPVNIIEAAVQGNSLFFHCGNPVRALAQ